METGARPAATEEELNRKRTGARMIIRKSHASVFRNEWSELFELQVLHKLWMVHENSLAIMQISPGRIDISHVTWNIIAH